MRSRASASPQRPGDLEAGVLEQPGEALAQQRLVVGDHDAHGISRRSSPSHTAAVPPTAPTRSRICSIAPSSRRCPRRSPDAAGRSRRRRPRSPRARSGAATRRWRSRPPTRPRRGSGRPARRAARVEGRARTAPPARRASPSSASTAGNRPWATSRSSTTAARTPPRPRPGGRRAPVVGGDRAPRQPDGERDRDQALLRAVVQVALELAALGVGRGDDAGPGGAQLLEPARRAACRRSCSSARLRWSRARTRARDRRAARAGARPRADPARRAHPGRFLSPWPAAGLARPRRRSTRRPRGGRAARASGRRGSRRAARAARRAWARRRCRARAAPARPGFAGLAAERGHADGDERERAGLGEAQGAVRRVVGEEAALEAVERRRSRTARRRRPPGRGPAPTSVAGPARRARSGQASRANAAPRPRSGRGRPGPSACPSPGASATSSRLVGHCAQPCVIGIEHGRGRSPSTPTPLPNATPAARQPAGRVAARPVRAAPPRPAAAATRRRGRARA